MSSGSASASASYFRLRPDRLRRRQDPAGSTPCRQGSCRRVFRSRASRDRTPETIDAASISTAPRLETSSTASSSSVSKNNPILEKKRKTWKENGGVWLLSSMALAIQPGTRHLVLGLSFMGILARSAFYVITVASSFSISVVQLYISLSFIWRDVCGGYIIVVID